MTEDEMVVWHHQLNGHEFEQTPGNTEGQGSLAGCSSWGPKESDMTQQMKNNNMLTLKYDTNNLSAKQKQISIV